MNKKIDARELLGLQPVQQGPLQMHDAGVAATLMDGTVYKAAIDLWLAAGDANFSTNFPRYARMALDSLDEFRVVVAEWSNEKQAAALAAQAEQEVTA
jgi:hypothetical protein